ncbi:ribonuclease H-like domain-containing protein [Tanacetum coccineum]
MLQKVCRDDAVGLSTSLASFQADGQSELRFGKKGKLAPRYVRPFEILERISLVAYRLRLPEELSSVHDTFHVSNLKKCLANANLHVPLDEIKVDKTLCFVEEPVEIMDREIKKLKRRKIALVKVRWNSKRGPEFTWEHEDQMRIKYPQLFVDQVVVTGIFERECRLKDENRRRMEWNPGHKDGSRAGKKEESKACSGSDTQTGNYLPSGPDIEIDDSQYTYGPEKTQPSEPESQTNELDTCDSNISTEPSELVSEPGVSESNVEVQPKVWSDAPIIEEYESDSDDECMTVQTKGLDTPREKVKNQSTNSQKPKVNNKELGNESNERACFVCGSFSHLIRDCDYHVKLAKQVELNKQNMSKGNSTGVRKPIWNNVQRVNQQNQFVTLAVQTRTGINPVNTAKASSTKRVSTARQKVNKQTVLTSTALKVNTVKPIVNGVRPINVFHKTHSPSTRPFKRTTVLKTNFSKQKVYTVKVKEVSTVGEKWDTADNPHRNLQNKGIIDSGCSRHMTGNKAYLADFQDFNGGPVAFGGSKGYITGKGKIKTGKLDFEDVSFVKELQPFNLFSVSQMCDKKNKVLFTDSECLVLSPDFKLPDENQILLKVPRQNNMYSFNLENIVPLGGLACLIAKATTDESNLWHRRLGHVNFKNLNRLVKGNLVRAKGNKQEEGTDFEESFAPVARLEAV